MPSTPALFRTTLLVGLITLAAQTPLHAQPSGGPYGPLPQTYTVPADAAHVYYVAPDGQADAAGTTLAAPTTLESALTRVVTTDAIILRGGTYRTGGLRLNQGITIQPYADERPVLKGTAVATQWETLRRNVWRTKWTKLFPQQPADWWRREREGMRTPLHRFNNDLVFVDGRMLQSAGWEGELDADHYSIDYEHGYVYLGTDPAGHTVEITVQDSALVRTTAEVHGKISDGRGYTLRGLTFTQYAYRALEIEGKRSFKAGEEITDEPIGPADPSTYGKGVVGSTIEHCTITGCSRVAGYFRGDRLTFRHNLVSDTSTEGIYLIASSDCLFEKNIFRRNNVEHLTGYYPAAVKIFNQTHRITCRDNLVLDQPDSNGIWYDVGNCDGVFVNNWVQDCQDGFFFEISQRVICAGNVFVRCDNGVRILNSAGARIHHNTFLDAPLLIERTERSAVGDHFGWHPATGPAVDAREGHVFTGNLLASTPTFTKPLLRFLQTKPLYGQLTRPQPAQLDGNIYIRGGAPSGRPLLVWSPAAGENCTVELAAPAELTKLHPLFEAHSAALWLDPSAVFQNPELQRYALIHLFPGTAGTLPDDIRALLGWPAKPLYAPGAYQPEVP